MKRLLSVILALALCLTPAVAFASGHNYEDLNGRDIRRRGNRGAEITRIQQRLAELGYLTDKVDGSYGARTEDAVWAFQRNNGITPSGVATMFTQAVLFGSDVLRAWDSNTRPYIRTGDYAIQGLNTYPAGNGFTVNFDFVNKDSQNVEAICIYYWLDDGSGHLVSMDKFDYYMKWYYNYNVSGDGTLKVKHSLNATSSEMRKAHELRCIVGEVAYTDGSVVVNMNASLQPYQNACYVLCRW